MATLESRVGEAPGAMLSNRMYTVLRAVNRELARRVNGATTAFFVCECDNRSCVEAVEAPPGIFALAARSTQHALVRPGHYEPRRDRVVRRDSAYAVVER